MDEKKIGIEAETETKNEVKAATETTEPDKAHALSKAKLSRKERKERKALLRLYRKGSVSEEYLVKSGISEKSFSFVYACGRKNKLSVAESFYNAAYVSSLDKFENSDKKVASELKNTFSHPKGWYEESAHNWKTNFWSTVCSFLGALPHGFSAIRNAAKKSLKKMRKGYNKGTSHMYGTYKIYLNFFRYAKKLLGLAIPVLCIVLFVNYASSKLQDTVACTVYINGQEQGSINDINILIDAKNHTEDAFSKSIGYHFYLSDDIDVKLTTENKSKIISESELYSVFNNVVSTHIVPGYGLYIDDQFVAASENHLAVETIAAELKEIAKAGSEKNDGSGEYSVKVVNKIEVISKNYSADMLKTESEIREALGLKVQSSNDFDGLTVYEIYYDTLKRIKKSLGFEEEPKKIEVMSHGGSDSTSPFHGTNPSEIVLEYTIVRVETVEEDYAYSVEEIESDKYLLGTQKIEALGSKGRRIATYSVTYDKDGNELSRELVEQEITKPAKNRVVYVGTRIATEEELATTATGTFIMPYENNYISSGYGLRNVSTFGTREFHNAWDITGPYAAPIKASDGGVVSHVGFTSGYGNHVIIDHENGYETVYAHLSQATVKKGTRVGQGSIIGKMGATGRVTGVHVHFEIRKDGATVDPREFFDFDIVIRH